MLWIVLAIVLVLWLVGLILQIGPLVNLLLVLAGVLLVAQVINERDGP